jgi:hypothetical protein
LEVIVVLVTTPNAEVVVAIVVAVVVVTVGVSVGGESTLEFNENEGVLPNKNTPEVSAVVSTEANFWVLKLNEGAEEIFSVTGKELNENGARGAVVDGTAC